MSGSQKLGWCIHNASSFNNIDNHFFHTVITACKKKNTEDVILLYNHHVIWPALVLGQKKTKNKNHKYLLTELGSVLQMCEGVRRLWGFITAYFLLCIWPAQLKKYLLIIRLHHQAFLKISFPCIPMLLMFSLIAF